MVALGKIGPGEIFGEMYLWDKEKKRFASAIATQETILEVIFDSELTPEVYSQICSDMIKKVKNTSVTYTQAVRKARINSPEGSQPGVVPNKRLMTSNSRAPRIPADVIVLNNSDY
jgi:sensor c-di-GMP phosphodiesterase-like protein